jgi:acyl-coenzyme A thioesterase PaaI-like protein
VRTEDTTHPAPSVQERRYPDLTCFGCGHADAAGLRLRSFAAGGALPYVTAALDVRFLRPTPLTESLRLTAVVTAAGEAEMTVDVGLVRDGKPRATATAVWKRWRARRPGAAH